MNLLLSEDIPLRTTRMLGDYSVDAVLPQRFGDLTAARFNLIRLTDSKWFAADHAMTITTVFIGDQVTASWDSAVESDGLGNSWTVVNFGTPVATDTTASACGTGKRNPKSGALLDNPAEIIEYVCTLCGRDDTFPDLRAECAGAGFRIAGSIEVVMSLRAWIDIVTSSVAAIWTPLMGRLYPTTAPSGYIRKLSRDEVDPDSIQITATITDTADILRLSYDVADATQKPQHYIELTASPMRYGGVVQEIVLPMLRSPANAEAVGRPWTQRVSGKRFTVEFNTSATDVRPGQYCQLVDNPGWRFPQYPDPIVMVLAVTVDRDTDTAQVTSEAIVERPDVTVTAHSLALPDITAGGIDAEFKNGILTLTVTDTDESPIQGARVALDGSAPKTTDARGIVSFPTTQGKHTLAVEAPGKVPEQLSIDL